MFGLKYAFSLLRHQSSFERYDDTWAFPFGKQTGLKVSQLNETIQNRTKCKEKMVVFGWADELLITKIDQLIRRAIDIKLIEQSVQILLNLFLHG